MAPDLMKAVRLILVSTLFLAACMTPSAPISDEERCTRFGGIWQMGACRQAGAGGGSM